MGAIAEVIIQAGHSAWTSISGRSYPVGGGAPGEADWAWKLANRIAALLAARGIAVSVLGQWYNLPPPPEAARVAALFVSVHYDAAIYGIGRNTGCFGDGRRYTGMPAIPADFLARWSATYPAATGIPLTPGRANENTSLYYAYSAVTNAPACLLEHGCGSPVPVGSYPPGQDAAFLHGQLETVAVLDAAAIVDHLIARGYPVEPLAPPVPIAPPVPPDPEEVSTMTDWQIINWILADYYAWSGLADAFNGDSAINKSWVDELRAGRYHGRPRTAERAWGDGDGGGVWQEWDLGTAIWSPATGASWTG